MAFEELRMSAPGLSYNDESVTLSSGQAAGTTAVIAENMGRRAIKFIPPTDCRIQLASGGDADTGVPIFADVEYSWVGGECPINALFVTGLSEGDALTIWEA